jgi:predicted  nucleic acid-binding Zn-ribbon protein
MNPSTPIKNTIHKETSYLIPEGASLAHDYKVTRTLFRKDNLSLAERRALIVTYKREIRLHRAKLIRDENELKNASSEGERKRLESQVMKSKATINDMSDEIARLEIELEELEGDMRRRYLT